MARGLHWFRNDLRLHDNSALNALAEKAEAWLPVFILDPRLFGGEESGGPRKRFLLDCLSRLRGDLEKLGVPLMVRHGRPEEVLPRLLTETGARLLSFNRATTPFARQRDAAVSREVEKIGGETIERLDHVVFASSEIRTQKGRAYSVYSPYRKTWWQRWMAAPRLPVPLGELPPPIPDVGFERIPDPREFGLDANRVVLPTGGEVAANQRRPIPHDRGGALSH
jgi:deoxyribodipyrimidine photo-lyase